MNEYEYLQEIEKIINSNPHHIVPYLIVEFRRNYQDGNFD